MSRWQTEVAVRWRRLRRRVPQHVLYLQPGGLWDWPERAAPQSSPTSFDSFAAWCRAHPGADARLLLSGSQVHDLVVDPALGLQGGKAVGDYARQQFVHYHGAAARLWPLAVWSDGQTSIASAAHSLDLESLRRSAEAHAVGLRSLMPVWAAGLGSMARAVPAFGQPGPCRLALVEGALVTLMRTEGGRVVGLQQRHLDAPRSELLGELIRATGALAGSPLAVAVGWGLDDPECAASLPARVLGGLGAPAGFGPWVLDAMRATA